MPSIDLRIPLLAGTAIILLAFSPAKAATGVDAVPFMADVSATATAEPSAETAAPVSVADDRTDAHDAQVDMNQMADKLSDPRMQDNVANMVERMSETMLDLPIGKFAAAIEKSMPGSMRDKRGRRIRANDTLADIAGRDAERLPDQLGKGSKQMMGMMSGFAAAFASMLPEFEKLSREMENSFDDAKDAARHND
jgi:hypothetical protein